MKKEPISSETKQPEQKASRQKRRSAISPFFSIVAPTNGNKSDNTKSRNEGGSTIKTIHGSQDRYSLGTDQSSNMSASSKKFNDF